MNGTHQTRHQPDEPEARLTNGAKNKSSTTSKLDKNDDDKSSCVIELKIGDELTLDERTVEGDPRPNAETEQLSKLVVELQNQLDTQSKVSSVLI